MSRQGQVLRTHGTADGVSRPRTSGFTWNALCSGQAGGSAGGEGTNVFGSDWKHSSLGPDVDFQPAPGETGGIVIVAPKDAIYSISATMKFDTTTWYEWISPRVYVAIVATNWGQVDYVEARNISTGVWHLGTAGIPLFKGEQVFAYILAEKGDGDGDYHYYLSYLSVTYEAELGQVNNTTCA